MSNGPTGHINSAHQLPNVRQQQFHASISITGRTPVRSYIDAFRQSQNITRKCLTSSICAYSERYFGTTQFGKFFILSVQLALAPPFSPSFRAEDCLGAPFCTRLSATLCFQSEQLPNRKEIWLLKQWGLHGYLYRLPWIYT